jgi:hypothetical protein
MQKSGKYIAVLMAMALAIPCFASTPTVRQHSMGPNGSTENLGNGAVNSAEPYKMGLPYATAAGNTLLVGIWGLPTGGTDVAMTVADSGGDSFSQLAALYDSTNLAALYTYCASGIAAGSTWIEAYPTSSSYTLQFPQISVTEIQNASCTTRSTPTTTAAGSGSAMAPGSFSANAGDFIYEICGNGKAMKFSSITWGSGFHGLSADLYNGEESGLADQYEVASSTGSINPSMSEGSSDGAWEAIGLALDSSASGTGPAAFGVLSLFHANYYNATAITSWTYQFPVHGNLIVIQLDNNVAVTGITDNNSLSFQQIGATCPKSSGTDFGQAWYATVSSPPLENEAITVSIGSGTGTYIVAFTYDIQGANTSSPYDTTIGTSGLACASGDQTVYVSTLAYFTITPTNSNEIMLFHSNQDYNDAIGLTSPGAALFTSAIIANGGNFNYTLDESSGNGICVACSGSLTWTVTYDNAYGGAEGYFEGFAAAFNPASTPPGNPYSLRGVPHFAGSNSSLGNTPLLRLLNFFRLGRRRARRSQELDSRFHGIDDE